MDHIIIRDLAVACRVGVTEAERAQTQRLLLTVEADHDLGAAAAADDLTQTIDYHAVCRRLLHLGEGRQWKLIETLAVEIASIMKTEFRADAVSVEVKKFVIPEAAYVAVRVTRR
jgi:7,8-dihydroneopterin aldolase/epimerase/oxygenase